jgi:hypothetical protein
MGQPGAGAPETGLVSELCRYPGNQHPPQIEGGQRADLLPAADNPHIDALIRATTSPVRHIVITLLSILEAGMRNGGTHVQKI